jgi:hypothetical protein
MLLRQWAYPISDAGHDAPSARRSHGAVPSRAFRRTWQAADRNSLRLSVGQEARAAPSGAVGLHHAQMFSGAIRSQIDNGLAGVYRACDRFYEMPGQHHRVSENARTTETGRLHAGFIADLCQPLTIPDAICGAPETVDGSGQKICLPDGGSLLRASRSAPALRRDCVPWRPR